MSMAIVAAPILVRQAIREHQAGQFDAACDLYERALEIDPADPDALNLLGALHLQQGNLTGAIPYSARAVLSEPRSASAYNNLGLLMKLADQAAGAARCYYQATLVNTNFAEAHCNLGVVLKAEGQTALAISHYRRATELDPTLGEAFNNLGNGLQELGELEEAVESYLIAAKYMVGSDTVHYNVGLLLDRLGRKEEALVHLREALRIEPKRDGARHLIAALEGETTDTAPDDYVRSLFDDYAHRFEAHLVGELRYSTHKEIAGLIQSIVSEGRRFARAFDLGCGTGLIGVLMAEHIDDLVGVDLSEKMLAQAAAKGIYDRLVPGDIDGFLDAETEDADLVVASDVFVYLGRLDETVRRIIGRMTEGGLLAFSVESAADPVRWFLRPSGRYAHGDAYVRGLLADGGLRLLAARNSVLRHERGEPLDGRVYLAVKPAAHGNTQ
ncbi:MAG: tetratricopeptide repeat protein [Alphaproteobacteria bacterium]|nr:tetratricopeptide repeat protein [Alphaproteobacteria bacterium]